MAHALEVEASAYARYGEAAAPDATKREAVRVRRNPEVRIQGLRAGQAVPRDPLRVHGWALPSARSALTRVESSWTVAGPAAPGSASRDRG